MPKAIAKERGYYPLPEGGPCRIVEPGETFDLVAGLVKGKWFTVLPDEPKKAEAKGKKDESPLA